MSHSSFRAVRAARLLLGAAVVGLFLSVPAAADVVILKDGYSLYGKIIKERAVITDKESGQFFVTMKLNGLTVVDDGGRWTAFSDHQRQVGDVQTDFNKYAGQEVFTRRSTASPTRQPLPPVALIPKKATEWNDAWMRVVTLEDPQSGGFINLRQMITALTPHFVRVDSPSHGWNGGFLTKEFQTNNPGLLRKLLRTHPDLVEKDGKPDPDKRMRIARFFIQAEMPEEAEKELAEIEKLFPDFKDKVAKSRDDIRAQSAETLMADIERAKEAGRHTWARSALQTFPRMNVPKKLIDRVDTLVAEYGAAFKQFEAAKRLLADLVPKAKNPDLKAGGAAVLAELHPDEVGRVETFIVLAEQTERDRKNGRKVLHDPDQLLAAAITGWLMGKNATETNGDSAIKFWKAREMALKYQRTPNFAARDAMLQAFLKTTPKMAFDELAQLISLLPPADADPAPPAKPVMLNTGAMPHFQGGVNYIVQVPPEYQPGRPYPLLIVLPDANGNFKKPADLLKSMGDLPARHGYIVAVPEWHNGFQNQFDFGSDELHLMVRDLVRLLKRRYQVDSDRVFLFGVGEGASMALEVGAGCPDLFAGVIPMNPLVSWWVVKEYFRNYQQLPLYLIAGDQINEDKVKAIRRFVETVLAKGYPTLLVSYKGRGNEWFGAELPYMFDWMSRKKRALGVPNVGRFTGIGNEGEEYRTMRTIDNRFYWISTEEIFENCLRANQKGQAFYGAALQGQIMGEQNELRVSARRVRDVSIWLGRDMVDFSKEIKIKVNGAAYPVNNRKPITPDMSVLMEDLYDRADRQRPYFYKITVKLTR